MSKHTATTIWRCGACGRISSIDGNRLGLRSQKCGDCAGHWFPVPKAREAQVAALETVPTDPEATERQS